VLWDGLAVEFHTRTHQKLAADRLVLDLWDVPLKTTDAVADELTSAGFVDVAVARSLSGWLVQGRQP
jgi:hypothetical protein